MNNEFKKQFIVFIEDLNYVREFAQQFFGSNQILLNKNGGSFSSSDYQIKHSRIKGYAFHGYGCIFQFKDFRIDVDLRFDKIGFTLKTFELYLEHKNIKVDLTTLEGFLNLETEHNNLELKEGIYLPRFR